MDQYYLGANNSIQHAAVHYILDTVIEELSKNPARKFIYVEQAFFQMWYSRQTSKVQQQTKALVANGQLEFINGSATGDATAAASNQQLLGGVAHVRSADSLLIVLFCLLSVSACSAVGACTTRLPLTTWI